MAALKYIISVLLLTLSPKWSESLKCFQCSQRGKFKCPTSSDSRTSYESIENQYISAGNSSEIGCSLQIGYNDEVFYQGTMSLKDCTEKKSIYLTRVKNFTCCFGCDGCNWDINNAFSSKCSGEIKKESQNKEENPDKNKIDPNNENLSSKTCSVDATGFDYKLASLILLISTILLILVVVVLWCILSNRICCSESRPGSPLDYPPRNNIEPSNLSHYPRKHDSYE